MIDHLGPRQVAERLRSDEPPLLVDVREGWEREIANIPGSRHIPMTALAGRLDEIPSDRDVILYCHHGARSLQVARWLEWQGYTRLANLEGGIDAWSLDVDPQTPRYS
jgi:rhodanese-related sulfurtransferase